MTTTNGTAQGSSRAWPTRDTPGVADESAESGDQHAWPMTVLTVSDSDGG